MQDAGGILLFAGAGKPLASPSPSAQGDRFILRLAHPVAGV